MTPSTLTEGGLAVSPDGQTVVFAARGPEGAGLYCRRLDEYESHLIRGTEGAANAFFSPSGDSIVFTAIGKGMRKVPLRGGP